MPNWPELILTVSDRVGIGTDTPSQELDVRGNSIIDGSLTINQNLTVSGNFQLGTLAVNEFSSDGNLADNSNLAVPTEQAVKTYVDNNLDRKAALNGAADEDFAANNLSVDDSLTVGNAIATKQLSVSDSVTVENDLTVNNAIATSQLSVTDQITGSLKIENNLTLGGKVGIGITTPEAELHVIGKLLGAAQDISGKALRICCGKTPEGSTNWEPYTGTIEGIQVDIDTSVCNFESTPIYIVNIHGNGWNWETTGGSSPYNRTNQGFRIYVRFPSDREGRPTLTPSFANSNGWHIQWIAIGN